MQYNPIIGKLEAIYGCNYSYDSIIWQIIKAELSLKINHLNYSLCRGKVLDKFINEIKNFINSQSGYYTRLKVSEAGILTYGHDQSILKDFDGPFKQQKQQW